MTTQTTAQKPDTRERLIEAAATLIHLRSYEDVGVKAICGRAGVKRGSFYHFFDSKEALVLATLDERWAAFKNDHLDTCFAEQTAPRERVLCMYQLAHRWHTALGEGFGRIVGCPFGNLAAETSTLSDPIRVKLRAIFEDWAGYFERAVRDGLEAGEIDPAVDPASAAWTLLGGLQGSILMAKTMQDTHFIRAAGSDHVRALWRQAT